MVAVVDQRSLDRLRPLDGIGLHDEVIALIDDRDLLSILLVSELDRLLGAAMLHVTRVNGQSADLL